MERIRLFGRLGFSVDSTAEEWAVLVGEDRKAANVMLLQLVANGDFRIGGNAELPSKLNGEIVGAAAKKMGLGLEMMERLEFQLPEKPMQALPCALGDTVFLLNRGKTAEYEVNGIELRKDGRTLLHTSRFLYDDFETFFLLIMSTNLDMSCFSAERMRKKHETASPRWIVCSPGQKLNEETKGTTEGPVNPFKVCLGKE